LVNEISLYYDARSEKQKCRNLCLDFTNQKLVLSNNFKERVNSTEKKSLEQYSWK